MISAIASSCSGKKGEKPNIVYILTDQWRASATGYAGDPNVQTPSLDRFASEAVRFTNAVSVCPVCTPYRASLLTGKYPTTTGMFLNDAYLPEEEVTLAEILKENGYHTGYIGKWHLDGHGRFDFTPPERRQGFDYWKALECSHNYNHMAYYEGNSDQIKYWEGYSPFAISEDAQAYMTRYADSTQPFFLFVAFATPHFPHASALEEFKELYPDSILQLPPNIPEKMDTLVKKELRGYYAHCTATDLAIGALLEKIRTLGLWEKSIIFFTSDHGEIMGAHGIRPRQKQVPWIESAGVPLIIHYPGSESNRSMKMAVNTPDISATLLDLAGVKPPEFFEGTSFAPNLKENRDDVEKGALYMMVSSFASVRPEVKKEYRAIKTAKYTYVKDVDGPWLMFDDVSDPYQTNNLANKPAYNDLEKRLDDQLMDELHKINDDFRPASSYLLEWGYHVQPAGHISYQAYDQVPQSPKRK